MNRIIGCILLLAATGLASAQVKDPSRWTFTAKRTGAGTYEVRATVTLEKGWHIYSQSTPDGGPSPTAFSFTGNPLLVISGAVKELGKMEKHNEPLFGVDVWQYSTKVEFVQSVKVKGNAKTSLTGNVEYMLCNDKECLPPATRPFSVSLK